MASKFFEASADATFDLKFWASNSGTVVSDIVHGAHVKSIRFAPGIHTADTALGTIGDSSRFNFWIYIVAMTGTLTALAESLTAGGSPVYLLRMTSGGVLQLWNTDTGGAQMGSDGPTLSTGKWYRICIATKITSTSVNRFEVTVSDDSLAVLGGISVTNATLVRTGSSKYRLGNVVNDATFDSRWSDFYIDDSNSLVDLGNLWVCAKRPFANGTNNDYTTQIGAGGSGYGTGHAPQVNERSLSTTNGWSMVGAGAAVTEEYSVEGISVGDFDLTNATIVDYMGWVYAKALSSETAQIVVGGATSNVSLTSSNAMFTKAKGSTTYPSGGTDIGLITSTTLTTVSLYECGLVFAFIPAPAFVFEEDPDTRLLLLPQANDPVVAVQL